MTEPKSKKTPKSKTPDTFESHLGQLEQIVARLESGELELEGALREYEDGVRRLRNCYQLLESAEQQVQKLVGDESGGSQEVPFEPEVE
jgi:exodeoxyribonuclease VII small subunit